MSTPTNSSPAQKHSFPASPYATCLFLLPLLLLIGCAAAPASGQTELDTTSPARWIGPLGLQFVRVGDPGNIGDPPANWYGFPWDPPFGDVDYVYWITAHEVTVDAWCAFLNSVATEEDPYELWIELDGFEDNIQRVQHGDGTYSYYVLNDRGRHPITRMDHRKIFRFCNWLHNGMQDDLSTTDNGAYDTSKWSWDGHVCTDPLDPEPGAKYWLTREDEWYKAAYYDPHRWPMMSSDGKRIVGWRPGYWVVPTRHNELSDPYEEPDADPFNCSVQCEFSSQPWGQCPLTQSPWGAFDMAGNAEEVIAEWSDVFFPEGTDYVTRGAIWADCGEPNGDLRFQRGYSHVFERGRRLSFRLASALPELHRRKSTCSSDYVIGTPNMSASLALVPPQALAEQ